MHLNVVDNDSDYSGSNSYDAGAKLGSQNDELIELDVVSYDLNIDQTPDQSTGPTSETTIHERHKNASETIDDGQYISRAPLHLAQGSKKCVSHERLEQLRKSFNVNRDPWTKEEFAILKENWKRIEKFYPHYSDPKFAFGAGHHDNSELTRYDINKLKREYREFDIMLRMAYQLDDRLICDIYIRCRKIFYNSSFLFNQRKDIPKNLEKSIRRDLKRNESPMTIGSKYNVSPAVIDMIKRRPKKKKSIRFEWTGEAQQNLKLLIERMYGVDDSGQLLAREIRWKSVAKELKTYGYAVNKEQCYNKWIKMMPDTIVRRYSTQSSSSSYSS